MKITAREPRTPDEVTLVLSTDEAYALMAVVGKVCGPAETRDGQRTVRGLSSDIYNGLQKVGFRINHKSAETITGSLRCKAS